VPLSHLTRTAEEALEVPRDLLLGRYPPFVTGGPLPRGDVPVFVFHSVEPVTFERQVRYLADNGYVSLSVDEYYQGLTGARPFPERAVLLTFDDGRGSLWSVGAPLLRRHGLRGVVFLVPARMRSRPGPAAPTLDDLEAGRVPAATLLAREAGDGAFLSWEEVAALARTGIFDFESHTLTHARIHVAPTVAGFVHPGSRRGYAAMDVPLIADGLRDLLAEDVPLGTPFLRSAPRTSEELRFFEEAEVRAACVATVAAGGGEAFFARPDWQARLRHLVAGQAIRGRIETPEEREASLRSELALARQLIEERTGRPALHLCYPWHTAGPTARRLARETGYLTAFRGKVPGVVLTRTGGDPQAIARIGEDYVELLPGRGRTSLITVLRRKWARRLRGA
jgi:peptidoglycan/xylan/chitin deacetylase (PgdA/CDA1 family)